MPQRRTKFATQAASEPTRFALRIGGFSLGLWCEQGMPVALDPEHIPFLAPSGADSPCDLEFDVSWASELRAPLSAPDFAPEASGPPIAITVALDFISPVPPSAAVLIKLPGSILPFRVAMSS